MTRGRSGRLKAVPGKTHAMDRAVLRDDMVDGLEHPSKGVVRSEAVGLAMRNVPRHRFVSDDRAAYADRPHREAGTTVLPPSTVARFLEALAPARDHRTLVVGAGAGYTAAVLAELVGGRNVHAVELSHRVVRLARRNLARAGYDQVLIAQGDGAEGLDAYAPYDRILVEAAVRDPPRRLLAQLAGDGRLVMPRTNGVQELVALEDGGIVEEHGSIAVRPLLVPGEQAGALERNRTAREDRELAARAAERGRGWERNWIDWDEA